MKKIILGPLISVITMGSSFAACTYNFDATAAQIAQFDSSAARFPVVNNQKVAFNVIAENDVKAYTALSSDYIATRIAGGDDGDIAIPTSGIFAYEYKIKVPTYLLNGDEALLFAPLGAFGTLNNQNTQSITLTYWNNTSTNPNKNEFKLFMNMTGNSFDMPVVATPSGYQTIGIYVNMDTRKVGVIYNGVNKGYVAPITQPFNRLAFANLAGQYNFANNSSNLGQEISIELITDSTKLQNTYPQGTKDVCGTTL
ncbi:DUF4882 family protein [Acinetobacter haemolyticus]|uniref:DUF4882 family protein n=1 Tax=Acinetobacter haemolyticus TaxID=29430 RepID=UPI000F76058C|nr:DUF4882 family protein [Acinetobacter haemolyticus]AZN68666.1 DUF4882 domain-containing protein [Acinetobacter haemolyticus]